ncbi:MAG: cysteate synthase, partial [Marinilabiliales bacterium]|nr:cysteate synthase [Marinilabiliales bacterium]
MDSFTPTTYVLSALCCGDQIQDSNWELQCRFSHGPALLRTLYEKERLEIHEEWPGIYRFSDWLPVSRILEGSGSPITFKSMEMAKALGLENLYITFNGYWPEKGAWMKTGTFKECEAFSVCARKNMESGVMVVASAGNTARAFARVCSENKIPLLLAVPIDNIESIWCDHPL